MKIIHIVAGLPVEGGISQSVPELCRHLVSADVTVTLVSTGREGEISEAALQAQEHGVELVLYQPSWPVQLYFSIEMLRKLPGLIKIADVVHVHSQWTFPVWWGCHLALKYNKPLVMTPRGCLAPERLKISSIKKRLVGYLFDRRYLQRATVIHATCEREAEDINFFMSSACGLKRLKELKGSNGLNAVAESFSRKGASGFAKGYALTGKAQSEEVRACESVDDSITNELTHSRTNELGRPRIVVIPNGVDLAIFDAVAADREFVDAKWPECKGQRIALFLSRIHPIKGIESLIAAWCKVCASSPSSLQPSTFNLQPPTPAFSRDWILLIAGSGEDRYVAQLEQQAMGAGLSESVKFVGPVFGDEKIKLMKAAELFVLPTKNENFGIVVAESLACGVPVITTKGAPWSELRGSSTSVGVCECGGVGVATVAAPLVQGSSTNELTNSRNNARPLSGWWIDHGAEPLAEALHEAMALSDAERRTMGQNGRKLVEERYQWSAVAEQMLKAGYASF